MILEKITCSDMREYNIVDDIIDLGKRWPQSEFAIQAHPTKFSAHMPRYDWFWTLANACTVNDVNLAMHINSDWRTMICNGKIPEEINNFLKIKRYNGKPVIGRVQININGGDQNYHCYSKRVADIIKAYPDIEFIFQYAPRQNNRIRPLNATNAPFSLLYDASCGRGIMARKYRAPIMPNHKMGYSGGLSPENVAQELAKINLVLPYNYVTWIDAEGKLRNPETGHFDIERAAQYIQNAHSWNYGHRSH